MLNSLLIFLVQLKVFGSSTVLGLIIVILIVSVIICLPVTCGFIVGVPVTRSHVVCRWCGVKFLWLMQRDGCWQMPFKILITSTLFYFLIGEWVMRLLLFCSFWLTRFISLINFWFVYMGFSFLQLCASVSFWLYLQLSDAYEYQLCRLVCQAVFHNGGSYWVDSLSSFCYQSDVLC